MTAVAENKTNETRAQKPQRVRYARPDVDITEFPDYFLLSADLPGVKKEGLKITMEEGELSIEGRKDDPVKESRPVYRESYACDYRRVFQLDAEIDAAGIKARLNQGILTVTLPKAEQAKPRKIEIA